jgi:glyoxylase I family protein
MANRRLTKGRKTTARSKPPFALGSWAVPSVAGGRNLDHLCLALGMHDEAKLRRHLARHRIAIIEEGIHGGSRGESLSLYVRDPSGNVIELKGPPAT